MFLLIPAGRIGNVDASVTLEMTRSLLRGGVKLPDDCRICVVGRDGMRTSQYGVGHSVYWMPYVVLGRAAARLTRLPENLWEEFFVSFANGPVILLLLGYLGSAWRRAGASDRCVGWGLVLFAGATLLGPYAKLPFSDSLLALGAFAAWWHWTSSQGRGPSALAGMWLGFAMLSRRQADAVVPVLAALALVDSFRKGTTLRFAWLLLGLLPAIALRLWYNEARFGDPWTDTQRGISTASIFGPRWHPGWVISMLTASSSGWLPYNLVPLLTVSLGGRGLWRARREDGFSAAALVGSGLVLLAALPFPPGLSFGARYSVYFVPFLGLAWPWVRWPSMGLAKVLLSVAAAVSCWLMISGVCLDVVPVWMRELQTPGPAAHWKAVALEWRRVLSLGPQQVDPSLQSRPEWSHEPFQRPDLWWCHAFARWRSSGRADGLPQGPAGAPATDR